MVLHHRARAVAEACAVSMAVFQLLACRANVQQPSLRLSACQLSDSGANRIAARCGHKTVPEDRDTPSARSIELFVAVLPATGAHASQDPVFLLAGGPGGAITREFPKVASVFARMNVKHDLVLVDQRGTGRSHPIHCPSSAKGVEETGTDLQERLRSCLAHLDADPRHYGTYEAVMDLDDVRAALGYERIHLYGGSYGTRVAVAYANTFPTRSRSMILDGVAPIGPPLGSTMARDAQRALDGQMARCASNAACKHAFPDLAGDMRGIALRLVEPLALKVSHPTTAEETPVLFSRNLAAGTVRFLTYASETASILPLLLHTAASGNFQPLAAQALMFDDALSLSEGVHFSVLCTEDVPRFGPMDEVGTYFEGIVADHYGHACSVWPKGLPRPQWAAPVHSNVPTLLLSGELDPVTPPSAAELAARTLPMSKHIILAGESHGVLHRGCVPQIAAAFVDCPDLATLDVRCLEGHRPLPFFTSQKGPEP